MLTTVKYPAAAGINNIEHDAVGILFCTLHSLVLVLEKLFW